MSSAWLAAAALLLAAPAARAIGTNCQGDLVVVPQAAQRLVANDAAEGTAASFLPALEPVPKNLKIAFVGDQGLGANSVAVLNMIKAWGADFTVHSGDFDYVDNPKKWFDQLQSVIDDSYPYFTSIGNHDVPRWTGSSGYQQGLVDRISRSRTANYCSGEAGVNMVCNYKGVVIVYTGVGTRGSNHAQFIRDSFDAFPDAVWRVCSWHKNQRLFQTGGKSDEVGYEVYDTCRRYGAIIATGHEHSFARTHLMSNFASQTIASKSNTLRISRGETFAFVSGVAGIGIRDWKNNLEKNPWWAATASSDNGLKDGGMLCTFNVDGQENKASCEFRDRTGKVWDRFDVISDAAASSFVQADEEKEQCRGRFFETQVGRRNDDATVVPALGQMRCGDRFLPLTSNNGTFSLLRFRGVAAPSDASAPLLSAHLQIAGRNDATSSLPAGILVRAFLVPPNFSFDCFSGSFDLSALVSASVPSSASSDAVAWDFDDEDWERDAVWVSPSLVPLLTPLLPAMRDSEHDLVILVGGGIKYAGQEEKEGQSYEGSYCMAPTLAMQFGC